MADTPRCSIIPEWPSRLATSQPLYLLITLVRSQHTACSISRAMAGTACSSSRPSSRHYQPSCSSISKPTGRLLSSPSGRRRTSSSGSRTFLRSQQHIHRQPRHLHRPSVMPQQHRPSQYDSGRASSRPRPAVVPCPPRPAVVPCPATGNLPLIASRQLWVALVRDDRSCQFLCHASCYPALSCSATDYSKCRVS
jgi:hypothetical protein